MRIRSIRCAGLRGATPEGDAASHPNDREAPHAIGAVIQGIRADHAARAHGAGTPADASRRTPRACRAVARSYCAWTRRAWFVAVRAMSSRLRCMASHARSQRARARVRASVFMRSCIEDVRVEREECGERG